MNNTIGDRHATEQRREYDHRSDIFSLEVFRKYKLVVVIGAGKKEGCPQGDEKPIHNRHSVGNSPQRPPRWGTVAGADYDCGSLKGAPTTLGPNAPGDTAASAVPYSASGPQA